MTRFVATLKIGTIVKPMQSPVTNLMQLMHSAFTGAYDATVVDTGNNPRTVGAYYNGGNRYYWTGSSGGGQPTYGNDAQGIQVGSGNTPVALADYKLATPITHGSGGGQLIYSSQSYVANLSAGANRFFRLLRYFVNNSGAPVTVREVSQVVKPATSLGVPHNVLITRDLTGDIVIADGSVLPVEIMFQTTA